MSRITDRRLLRCFHFQCTAVTKPFDYTRPASSTQFQSSWPFGRRTRCQPPPIDLAILSPHYQSARVALPLEYIAGENGSPSIPISARTYRTAPPAITNHIATLSFPHTSILPPYVIGQSSRYPREIVNNSIFGDPGRVSVGPMMELSSVTPPCMIKPQALCSTQMHHGRGLQAAYRPHFRNGIYRMTSPTTTFRFL